MPIIFFSNYVTVSKFCTTWSLFFRHRFVCTRVRKKKREMRINRYWYCGLPICVLFLISLLCVSFSTHEITNVTGKVDDFAKAAHLFNRSLVFKFKTRDYCRAPRVAVLVSPNSHRFVQIYWDVEYIHDGDWIGLFRNDPRTEHESIPIFAFAVQNTTGFVITDIVDVPVPSDSLNFTSQCLQFWVVYFDAHDAARAISCQKTNPTWMYEMRDFIGDTLIKRLFIPGTHDAGSYRKCKNRSSYEYNVLDRYVFTQEEDVLTQLVYGIRYLDLRISSNPNLPDRWWINHGIVPIQPLKNVLDHVKTFLKHTNEIIILDFHNFPQGFRYTPDTHREFVGYLQLELSEWIAPANNWSATCNDLWNNKKTLILSYNDDETVQQYRSILWTPVVQKWANVQNSDDLKRYFEKVIENRPTYSWAAMAELTPTLWSIFTFETHSLRQMAQLVDTNITNWFRGTWGRICNIVAVDFFRGTDIVQAAIEWNYRRNTKHICDISHSADNDNNL